jgi:hypothetical protein
LVSGHVQWVDGVIGFGCYDFGAWFSALGLSGLNFIVSIDVLGHVCLTIKAEGAAVFGYAKLWLDS